MSCSKLKPRFRDANVERLIVTVEQAAYEGEPLVQQVKLLKQKIKVWEELSAEVCEKVTALADEIDQDHKNFNKAKLVGSSVGAAAATASVGGGIAVGVGLFIAPATAGLSIPIGAAVALIFGAASAAGAAGTGVAIAADETLQYINKKKALELLQSEKELREHITNCMLEVQRASEKFEESINLIRRMLGLPYSSSLKSIEETKQFLHSLMDWAFQKSGKESHMKKIVEGCKQLLSALSNLDGLQSLLSLLSVPGVLGAIGVAFSIASAPIHIINLITTSVDYCKGSKTKVAAKLRKHVELLEDDRAHVSEVVESVYP